jgi:hypothetical protein
VTADDKRTDDEPGAVQAGGAADAPTASEAERDRADARSAELKSELAATDARRAEEETAKAHGQVEQAQQQEEKLSRKEQRAREKAKAADEAAERARREAEQSSRGREQAERRDPQAGVPHSVSGASVASPGIGSNTDPNAAASAARGATAGSPGSPSSPPMSDRPEIMVGAAFAGAFVFARVLKRLFD